MTQHTPNSHDISTIGFAEYKRHAHDTLLLLNQSYVAASVASLVLKDFPHNVPDDLGQHLTAALD